MKQFLAFAAIVFAAAAFGSIFGPDAWFNNLRKPSWQPPGWVFGPVWTTLYTFIALAGWCVYRRDDFGLPIALWGFQLLLNALWSWLFFGAKRIDLAMIDISILWVVIIACIAVFYRISYTAALLFVPYALWVGFAAVLNFVIWRMNRPS